LAFFRRGKGGGAGKRYNLDSGGKPYLHLFDRDGGFFFFLFRASVSGG